MHEARGGQEQRLHYSICTTILKLDTLAGLKEEVSWSMPLDAYLSALNKTIIFMESRLQLCSHNSFLKVRILEVGLDLINIFNNGLQRLSTNSIIVSLLEVNTE